jgi:uncharacterized membrane protein YphA (DoxX/SURF4 family)
MKGRWIAYAIFRLALGVNIFIHGVVRISGSGVHDFASKTTQSFLPTFLPIWSVFAFLIVLPFVEAALGALIALGLLTKWSLIAGSLLMVLLIFWNCPSERLANEFSVDAFFLRKGMRNVGVRHERRSRRPTTKSV